MDVEKIEDGDKAEKEGVEDVDNKLIRRAVKNDIVTHTGAVNTLMRTATPRDQTIKMQLHLPI